MTNDPDQAVDPAETSLAPAAVASSMVTPAATIDEAVAQFDAYQELKTKLGRPEDFQTFYSDGQPKTFAKKSFVRKVARYFNISAEEVDGAEKIIQDSEGTVTAVMTRYRAVAPNGAFMEGDGSCERAEKIRRDGGDQEATIHNIRSHAHTRAKNRAIMDLCGFGDVTADELRPGDRGSGPAESQGHGICELHNVALRRTDKQREFNYPASHKHGDKYCEGVSKPQDEGPGKDLTAQKEFLAVLTELVGDDLPRSKWQWVQKNFAEYAAKGYSDITDDEWADMKAFAMELLGKRGDSDVEELPW